MKYPRPALLTLLSLLALLLTACSKPADPVVEIEQVIEDIRSALDERSNAGVREHLADSFLGGHEGQHNLDREAVRKLLAGYFLRYRNIQVLITSLEIQPDPVEPRLAQMQGTAALSGGNTVLPESARLYRFQGQWRKFGDDWKLTTFSWE